MGPNRLPKEFREEEKSEEKSLSAKLTEKIAEVCKDMLPPGSEIRIVGVEKDKKERCNCACCRRERGEEVSEEDFQARLAEMKEEAMSEARELIKEEKKDEDSPRPEKITNEILRSWMTHLFLGPLGTLSNMYSTTLGERNKLYSELRVPVEKIFDEVVGLPPAIISSQEEPEITWDQLHKCSVLVLEETLKLAKELEEKRLKSLS